MIQFNLLPDVKLEYIKTRRTKRMVISISMLVSALALFILLFLVVTVDILQKKNISDLSSDIKNYSGQLESTPNINKILTIQSQLEALPKLHDSKVVGSRVFSFIQSVTPSQATISDLKADFTANTFVITGQAPDLATVNAYTDTLKLTTYSTSDGSVKNQAAFSNVVLSSFSRNSTNANYTINLSFDPTIFSNANNVTLTIPTTTTARTDETGLFQGAGQ